MRELEKIIDHLVSQVFVSYDNTFYFNLRSGKDVETLTVDDTKTAVNNAKEFGRNHNLPAKESLNRIQRSLI